MFDYKTLVALGLPNLKPVLIAAMKGSGQAFAAGFDRDSLKLALARLAMSSTPQNEPLGDLADFLNPVKELLSEVRKSQGFYRPRTEPAPWRSWAAGVVEDSAVEQMKHACELPIAVGGALMPDAHTGYGLPIGGVLAVKNAVIPYAVGVDIACRMRLSIIDAPVSILETQAGALAQALESQTRFGIGATFETHERLHHPVMDLDWSVSPVTQAGKGKTWMQLGTSGSGNHFVEFGTLTVESDIDEPGLKVPAGVYPALLSHSGSRGTGEAVANYYSDLAKTMRPELPEHLKHLAWLTLDSEEGQQYWNAMELMGKYASANHELIHSRVLAAAGLTTLGYVENHHNFAWKEVYDGEELIVHRKGATPAGLGVLGIVPGSMGTRGFVVKGKGNPDSYASCSHGAGRKMSRSQAFKTLSMERMQELLKERGIRLLSGPLDESPEVYKDIEAVIAAQKDLVDVLAAFEPKIVKMAPSEGRHAWQKKKRKCEERQCS